MIDFNSRNVATDSTAENIAQQHIEYYKSQYTQNKNADKFGVLKIFPDADNQRVIYQGDNGWDDQSYTEHGYSSLPDNVRIWRKTFGFHTGQRDLNKDIEVTGYIKIPRLNDEYGKYEGVGPCKTGSGLSIKLRGGHHSNKSDASARCYVFHFEYEGNDNCKNFQKEFPHPNYAKETVETEFNAENWVGKWTGFKAITLNEGNDAVLCEAYIDYGGLTSEGKPANLWKRWYSIQDTGQYGKDDKTRPPFTGPNGDYIEMRMDNAAKNSEIKFASVRQIQKRSN